MSSSCIYDESEWYNCFIIDKHCIFGVVLPSNFLISCTFTLAKRSEDQNHTDRVLNTEATE